MKKDTPRQKVYFSPETAGEIEAFQGETLRPILKELHHTIIKLYYHYLDHFGIDLQQQSDSQRMDFAENALKKDSTLKNILIGSVIGHLNENELEFYLSHESELKKRITALLIKRIQDSIRRK
ncbi:hypothetical protein V6R21_12680 [Limibacter armeniacum]|uniref:hypothetical protein n=1 Tax=Limibacter armeniacum TaxID=466084 RepID=UPI002FE5B706